MRSYFDREVLMQSSIFELRNIARDIGVYSPTIYKKDDLIDKIFEIVNGDVKPYVPKSKQGRPPKSLSNPDRKNIFDKILPTQKTYNLDGIEEPKFILSESVRAYLEDSQANAKSTIEIEGTLDITKFGYGFLRNEGVYSAFSGTYVSDKIIAQNNLKAGDRIVGKARMLEEDKPYVLFEVTRVIVDEVYMGDFDKQPVTYSAVPLELSHTDKFTVGSANLFVQNKLNKDNLIDYISLDNSRYYPIYVGLELNREKEFLYGQLTSEHYYTIMTSSPEENINLIKFTLARAKNLVCHGKDVVLVVDSIDKVIRSQNLISNNNLLDIKNNTLTTTKEIVMSSRQLAKIGSLTIVSAYYFQDGNIFDSNILGELESYFANIIKV